MEREVREGVMEMREGGGNGDEREGVMEVSNGGRG